MSIFPLPLQLTQAGTLATLPTVHKCHVSHITNVIAYSGGSACSNPELPLLYPYHTAMDLVAKGGQRGPGSAYQPAATTVLPVLPRAGSHMLAVRLSVDHAFAGGWAKWADRSSCLLRTDAGRHPFLSPELCRPESVKTTDQGLHGPWLHPPHTHTGTIMQIALSHALLAHVPFCLPPQDHIAYAH